MPAARRDFLVYRGDTWSRLLTWKTPDSQGLPVPVDLSGGSARMQLRLAPEAAEVVLELNSTAGGITLGGTDGTLVLLMTGDQTQALDVTGAASGELCEGTSKGRGHFVAYDLEVTLGGTVTTLLYGRLCIVEDVTR